MSSPCWPTRLCTWGLYRQVIQYAETALQGARQHLTPALVADLSTLQAKACARMGDRHGCHASMRRSEEMAARIRLSEEPPETGYVQPGLVEVQHADALRRLGDLTAARSYAERSVAAAGQKPRAGPGPPACHAGDDPGWPRRR